MHNIYIVLLVTILSLNIGINSIVANQMQQSLVLINEKLVRDCIPNYAILDSEIYGYAALEIDQSLMKEIVNGTLKENYPLFNFEIYYYFYDARIQKSCSIRGSVCNSVQMKFIISYHKLSIERYKRFELIEKS